MTKHTARKDSTRLERPAPRDTALERLFGGGDMLARAYGIARGIGKPRAFALTNWGEVALRTLKRAQTVLAKGGNKGDSLEELSSSKGGMANLLVLFFIGLKGESPRQREESPRRSSQPSKGTAENEVTELQDQGKAPASIFQEALGRRRQDEHLRFVITNPGRNREDGPGP